MYQDINSPTRAEGGVLYVVATPIGHMEDVSLRAFRILNTVDWVAAEDTRHTGLLLQRLGLKKSMLSYHDHNLLEREGQLLQLLKEGQSVALVSDAGMPGICDPGEILVASCVAEGIPVQVIPGPSAFVTALAASGLSTGAFAFVGFFPRDKKGREAWLASYGAFSDTLVFYESPHRLMDTLAFLEEKLGDRTCCVARELTKHFETYYRGSLSMVSADLARNPIKGEIVVVLEGAVEKANSPCSWDDQELLALGDYYLSQGQGTKEASEQLAQKTGVPKKELYRLLIDHK